jgi:hypothetical protein
VFSLGNLAAAFEVTDLLPGKYYFSASGRITGVWLIWC